MDKQQSAVSEIRELDTVTITPELAARALGCDPQYLRDNIKDRPELIGFRFCRIGARTIIPRKPFLQFLTGEEGGV